MHGGDVVYNAFNAKNDMDGFQTPHSFNGVFTAPVDGAYMFFFRGLKVGMHKFFVAIVVI